MKKKLPGIYKGNSFNKSKNQKQTILSTELKKETINTEKEEKSINKQIKDIFSSPNYVYKADVTITMTDGQILKKTIIGRTNNSLITLDDDLIDVSKISQIDFEY